MAYIGPTIVVVDSGSIARRVRNDLFYLPSIPLLTHALSLSHQSLAFPYSTCTPRIKEGRRQNTAILILLLHCISLSLRKFAESSTPEIIIIYLISSLECTAYQISVKLLAEVRSDFHDAHKDEEEPQQDGQRFQDYVRGCNRHCGFLFFLLFSQNSQILFTFGLFM